MSNVIDLSAWKKQKELDSRVSSKKKNYDFSKTLKSNKKTEFRLKKERTKSNKQIIKNCRSK